MRVPSAPASINHEAESLLPGSRPLRITTPAYMSGNSLYHSTELEYTRPKEPRYFHRNFNLFQLSTVPVIRFCVRVRTLRGKNYHFAIYCVGAHMEREIHSASTCGSVVVIHRFPPRPLSASVLRAATTAFITSCRSR